MSNRRLIIGVLTVGILAVAATLSLRAADPTDSPDEATTVTSVFDVQGMTCGGCEVAVKRVVKKLDGVTEVAASYREGRATVRHDPEKVAPQEIVQAIEQLGYKAKLAAERWREDAGEQREPEA
ncbi:MAG: cation transporter [Thermoanaerobaculia bacterium]